MPNVKLKRLKIGKFRHVAPGTELVFNDGMNVLLGQNGTGKTTLLRLIATVLRWDFSALEDEEFELECEHVFPTFTVTTTIRNQRTDAHRASLAASDTLTRLAVASSQWSCRLALRLVGETSEDSLVLSSEPRGTTIWPEIPGTREDVPALDPFRQNLLLAVLQLVAQMFSQALPPPLAHQEKPVATAWKLIGVLGANAFAAQNMAHSNGGRFDEALTAFRAITGKHGTPAWGDLGWSFIAFRTMKQHDLSNFVPAEIIERLRDGAARAEVMRIAHADLEFLKKAVSILGFISAEMFVRLIKKERKDDGESTTYGDFEFLFKLDDGSIINHDDLSYGQKRLLSFLYYAAANPDVVIADELVNGMHYDWIETCVREIGDRQAFLTSQNPLLLDFLTFASPEEVARSFVLCSREKRDGRTRMVWANMSDDDARAFFRAYETEAQHVSEILRTKGLW